MDFTTLGQELFLGRLGVDASFHRVTDQGNITLSENGQFLSSRDTELPLNEIKPSNHLGDRVLDL